jgi:hypothetical protein
MMKKTYKFSGTIRVEFAVEVEGKSYFQAERKLKERFRNFSMDMTNFIDMGKKVNVAMNNAFLQIKGDKNAPLSSRDNNGYLIRYGSFDNGIALSARVHHASKYYTDPLENINYLGKNKEFTIEFKSSDLKGYSRIPASFSRKATEVNAK